MAVKKKNVKRKINSGLKAWNDAYSYFVAENKKIHKKYDYLGIRDLTKQFILYNYGKSWDKTDLDYYLTVKFEKFYDVSIKATVGDLDDIPYYSIDSSISGTRKGINVIVNGGQDLYGAVKINTANYNYQLSGLREMVERIRKDYGLKSSSEQPRFYGNLIKDENSPKDAKDDDPKYVILEWVLYLDGELVSEIKGMIEPSTDSNRDLIFRKQERKKSKYKSTTTTGVSYTAKEIIEMEKQKQATSKGIVAAEKQKQETEKQKQASIKEERYKLKEILKLVKAGYTKSEINKILKNK